MAASSSSSSSSSSSEARELELVERVDFRILAAANNEQKLQQLLRTYLPPLLLKAGSEHARVRDKVVEICRRLTIFIQPPAIILPVAALLDQYKSTQAPLVQHFDLVFMRHSVPRLDPADRAPLFPKAVRGIGSDTGAGLPSLFHIVLRLLRDLPLPPRGSPDDAALRERCGLGDARDAAFVAERLGELLLLRLGVPRSDDEFPGLPPARFDFLTLGKQDDTWDPARGGLSLPETRLQAARFLASGAFTDRERFVPAVYASAHPDARLASLGEDMLKRSTVSLEDPALVGALFQAHLRLPLPFKTRILRLLARSEVAATFAEPIRAVFAQHLELEQAALHPDTRTARAPGSLGLEFTRAQDALFQFLRWVAAVGPRRDADGDGDFRKTAEELVRRLQDYVTQLGWPVPDDALPPDTRARRSQAYEAIGALAQSAHLAQRDLLSLVEWLFTSLTEDPTPDAVAHVSAALLGLASVLTSRGGPGFLPDSLRLHMEAPVGGKTVRSARYVAVKLANAVLPFGNVEARWIDILAVAGHADEPREVADEGRRGLDPWTYYSQDPDAELPPWEELALGIFEQLLPGLAEYRLPADRGRDDDDDPMQHADGPPAFDSAALARIASASVGYVKSILFLTALRGEFPVGPDWEGQLDVLVRSDRKTRETIRSYLSRFGSLSYDGQPEQRALRFLLEAAFDGMVRGRLASAATFVELASFAPPQALAGLAARAEDALGPLVVANDAELRRLAARAYGILGAHPANSLEAVSRAAGALTEIGQTLPRAVGSGLNAVEGAFLALSHLLSRLVYYGAMSSWEVQERFGTAFPTLADASSAAPPSVQDTLFDSFAQLWTAGIRGFSVPRTGGDDDDDDDDDGDNDDDQGKRAADFIRKAFVEPLAKKAKAGNTKAITALGRLTMVCPESAGSPEHKAEAAAGAQEVRASDDLVELIIQKLYALQEIKQDEVHFAVGDALAAAIARWEADVVQVDFDVQCDTVAYRLGRPPATDRIDAVLRKLVANCASTQPSLLRATSIWLLCIVYTCAHLPEVQDQFLDIQAAFIQLLGARDPTIQETASQGLALLFARCQPSAKEALQQNLISSFSRSGPRVGFDADAEVPGAAGGSSSATTTTSSSSSSGDPTTTNVYTEIIKLANEVGDRSLIYTFMVQASRRSTRPIFKRFSTQLVLPEQEAVGPKLYPKLFRYRYDPSPAVQKAMEDIWRALVKDSAATVDKYFDEILRDLLKSILGRGWRVRAASCTAISALIQGRPFPRYQAYYRDIWAAALKVLDDVQDRVGRAALPLVVELSESLARQIAESTSPASAKAMIDEALPLLLSDRGIESGVREVQLVSLVTVMKMAKNGGAALRPYIATLVPKLLGLLSTVEPDALNYHYLRAGEGDRERIDKARRAMVSQSPIMEAVASCLRHLDPDAMAELAPALEDAIQSAVGMPTKIGCAGVLELLATRHAAVFRPFSARFLQLMEKQATDRNDEVSKGYARAAAYLVRVAPDPARVRFAKRLVDLYLESDGGEAARQKAADLVLALATISPDHLGELEGLVLPLCFLGQHDTDDYTREEFSLSWQKHAGSHRTATRYVGEIVGLARRSIDSAQWPLQHAGALAIAELASSVAGAGSVGGQVNAQNLRAVWPVFARALALKTFSGKEKLLDAFALFVDKGRALWADDAELAAELRKIAVREAKRNNKAYRPHALRCLWKFAAAREDLDMLGEICGIAGPYLEEGGEDDDDMDIDTPGHGGGGGGGGGGGRGGGAAADLRGETTRAAVEAIARGYNRQKMRADALAELERVAVALQYRDPRKLLPGDDDEHVLLTGDDVAKPFLAAPRFEALRRTFWYGCAAEVMQDAAAAKGAESSLSSSRGKVRIVAVLRWFLATLDLDVAAAGHGTEEQRMARADAVAAVLRLGKACGGLQAGEQEGEKAELVRELRSGVEEARKGDRSLEVQKRWKVCLELLEG